jgi:outer membrane autotransporter protein
MGVGRAARGLAAALVLLPGAAWAQQSSTWLANPGTVNFNTAANWSPAAVPNSGGTASFGASTRTTLNMNGTGTGTLQFNAGAPAYVFNRSFTFSFFTLDGAGIVNNSSNAPIFNLTSTFMEFDNSASAGNAIINMDGAALTFTGTTTAANATITNASGGGTLSFTDNSTAGSATIVTNSGLTQFTSSASGGNARFITNAGGTLDFSGLVTGGTTAGSIEGAGSINLGANLLTVGSNNLSTEVSGVISGTGGSLTKIGAGTLTLSGVNTYDGPTNVLGGRLAVNGSITSNVTVGSAGNLGGSGTIFGNVLNGGTISPGNSIGTLTIAGNYTQSAGSFYQAEVNNAGQSDRINVTGTSTLNGGTVVVTPTPGIYARSTTYTLLSAAGGLSGTFAGATTNLAFYQPSLSYDSNNIYLTLMQSFAGGGQTINQRNVGTALDIATPNASGDFANVLTAMLALSNAQGPVALDAISGQQYSGFGSANVLSSLAFMNVVGQQMSLARGGSGGGTRVALAEACDVACDGGAPTGPWSAWGGALGGTGSLAGNGNSSTLTYNLGGFATGIDYRFDPRFVAGLGIGYSSGNQWVSTFNSRGTSDSYNVSAYASFTQSAFYLDALAGYGYNNNQMTRQIAIPGLASRIAQGSTGANQFTGQAEAGYKVGIYAPAAASLTPFARFQTVAVGQNGFSENGANSLNLNVAQQNTTSVRTVLGGELSGGIDMGWRDKLAVQLRLGWAHEYADTTRPVTASFAGAPSVGFTVYGATPVRNAAVVGLAFNTAIADATSIYLRYDGELGTGTDNHVLSAGLRMSW